MPVSNNINDIQRIAKQFVEATLDKWGTEEQEVAEILRQVHDSDIKDEFEVAVRQQAIDSDFAKQIPRHSSLVLAILNDEMRGSALARAIDLYKTGRENDTSSYLNYFLEGLSNPFDLSSTGSKVVLGVGVAGFGILTALSAPVAAMVGGAFVIGGSLYGGGKVAKNFIEFVQTDSETEKRKNLRDLGEGLSIFVLSAPFLPKGIQAMKKGLAAFRVEETIAATSRMAGPRLVSGAEVRPALRLIHRDDNLAPLPSHILGPHAKGEQIFVVEGNLTRVVELPRLVEVPKIAEAVEVLEAPKLKPASMASLWHVIGLVPFLVKDSDPLEVGLQPDPTKKEKQQIERELKQLEHIKKRFEELLGYSLLIPALDHRIEALSKALRDESGRALGIKAVQDQGAGSDSSILKIFKDADSEMRPEDVKKLLASLPRLLGDVDLQDEQREVLYHWLNYLIGYQDVEVKRQVQLAIGQALGILNHALQDPDPEISNPAIVIFIDLLLRRQVGSVPLLDVELASEALTILKHLIKKPDPEIRLRVIEILFKIVSLFPDAKLWPQALEIIDFLLADSNPRVRAKTRNVLVSLMVAIELLIDEPEMRENGRTALIDLLPHLLGDIELLVQALKILEAFVDDADPQIRPFVQLTPIAALSLESHQKEAKRMLIALLIGPFLQGNLQGRKYVLRALKSYCHDSNPEVRGAVLYALNRMLEEYRLQHKPEMAEVIEVLDILKNDSDPNVQLRAHTLWKSIFPFSLSNGKN